MAVVATITIGSDTFSVYGLTSAAVADADAYFAGRLGAALWTGATTLVKQQGLITAARMLDRAVAWSGTKTVAAQALEWPRDGATCNGETVTDNTIPDDIARGEFELALKLIEEESLQDGSSVPSRLVKAVRGGPVNVEFFGSGASTGPDVFRRFPQVVHELVACYMAGGPSTTTPLASGVNVPENDDQVTQFDSADNSFDHIQGLP